MKKTILFISVCLIWGTTWLAMAIAGESIPSLTATGMRFLVMSPLLMLIAWQQGIPLRFPHHLRHDEWVVALGYFALPFWMMLAGERYIASGLAAIIFACMPLTILLLSRLFLQNRIEVRQLLPLLLAFGSLTGILAQEASLSGDSTLIGIGLLGGAVLLHAFMYLRKQYRHLEVHVLTYSALPSGLAALSLLAAGLLLEQPNIANVTLSSMLAVLYLGSMAGVGGIVAYFQLNALVTPFRASLCFLVFPVVAVTLEGWVTGRVLSTLSLWLTLPLGAGLFLSIRLPQPAGLVKDVVQDNT